MLTRAERLGGTGAPIRNSWRLQRMEIERFSRRVGRDPSPRKPVRLIGTLIDGHSRKAEGLCWRDRLPLI